MEIKTKKLIALGLTTAYIVLTVISIIRGVNIPETFASTVAMVIAYYFGAGNKS
jgi:hypothetical protein